MLVVVVGVVDAAAAAALGVPYEGVKTVRLDLLLPSVTVANRTRRRQLALLRAATALRASPHRRARLSYPALLWLSALNCATFYSPACATATTEEEAQSAALCPQCWGR